MIQRNKSFSKTSLNLNEQKSSSIDTRLQQIDRLNTTSVHDLSEQIDYVKKQKSTDLDSINTACSIPFSSHHSILSEKIINKHSQNHIESSRTNLIEDHPSVSSIREKTQQKHRSIMNSIDQIQPTNINLYTTSSHSNFIDQHTNQILNTQVNHSGHSNNHNP